METMERIWHNLFKRKKKKFASPKTEDGDDNEKENISLSSKSDNEDLQKVTVKASVVGNSKTFPRSNPPAKSLPEESSPALPRWNIDPVAASSMSLRGRKFDDPYDKNKWTSTQHFHLPPGTRPRHASSKGALSMSSVHTSSRRQLPRPTSSQSLRPPCHTPVMEPHNNLRRQVEPYDKIKDVGNMQHFHIPLGHQRNSRFIYNRTGQKSGMNQLVNNIRINSQPRPRSPSMNNEEPIQLAHYPNAKLRANNVGVEDDSPREELPSIFPFSDKERKRRRSGSYESQNEENDSDEEPCNNEEKVKIKEEVLDQLQGGIGKVFLDTIRKTEKIRNNKVPQIDPRSAARTPAANKMPKYRLRYDNPAWVSPSRDTYHGRPWDSEEDLCQQVVLTSSGCASGCLSDHLPHARSTSTLVRSVPSLTAAASGTLRYNTPIRPGYTQSPASATMPYVRSVSGRNISSEVYGGHGFDDNPVSVGNSHSGIVSSVNNSFSWATLAKYQEDTLNKSNTKNKFFARPELKHKRTILDI